MQETVGQAKRGNKWAIPVAIIGAVLVVAAAVGLLSSIFQAATQVQDAALAHLPKFVAVTIALALVGPWMGRQVLGFAVRAFVGH